MSDHSKDTSCRVSLCGCFDISIFDKSCLDICNYTLSCAKFAVDVQSYEAWSVMTNKALSATKEKLKPSMPMLIIRERAITVI
jgi:hypothetical protein